MPQILKAKIMHKRLRPKVNSFNYSSYYIYFNPEQPQMLQTKLLKLNKFGLQSFYFKDHGDRKQENPTIWARKILKDNNIDDASLSLKLLTMPRTLGYVFNPVSFWFFFDGTKNLRAVIVEVNNTFKETHSYLIVNESLKPIDESQLFNSLKSFHVSPFLNVEGNYEFRFKVGNNNIGVWIDYFDNEGIMLKTAITGKLEDFNDKVLLGSFLNIPLVTVKTIFLIHYQAVKLLIKKAKYFKKPTPPQNKVTKVL